jgi:hypothetical protein
VFIDRFLLSKSTNAQVLRSDEITPDRARRIRCSTPALR